MLVGCLNDVPIARSRIWAERLTSIPFGLLRGALGKHDFSNSVPLMMLHVRPEDEGPAYLSYRNRFKLAPASSQDFSPLRACSNCTVSNDEEVAPRRPGARHPTVSHGLVPRSKPPWPLLESLVLGHSRPAAAAVSCRERSGSRIVALVAGAIDQRNAPCSGPTSFQARGVRPGSVSSFGRTHSIGQ